MKLSEARALRHKIEHAAALQTDEDALQSIDFFPKWEPYINVSVGERYKYNKVLYKVIQAHTTQADWTPDKVPALFAVVSVEEWPEWVQPVGAQDAYEKGAKVTHSGNHWESDYDNNVWEPGVFGWTLIPIT